jgi:hypothetical protein
MKRYLKILLLIVVLGLLAFSFFEYYEFVFSQRVIGEIIEIERVTESPMILSGGQNPPSQIFSFAIAIKEKSGEIVTASSEDRQWAVAKRGMCVEAIYYPYPPWNLQKAGTYYNARLIKLMECAP